MPEAYFSEKLSGGEVLDAAEELSCGCILYCRVQRGWAAGTGIQPRSLRVLSAFEWMSGVFEDINFRMFALAGYSMHCEELSCCRASDAADMLSCCWAFNFANNPS